VIIQIGFPQLISHEKSYETCFSQAEIGVVGLMYLEIIRYQNGGLSSFKS
jgi:hypothetical protein